MIGLTSLVISWLIGYYVLSCFKGRDYAFKLMDIFLMIGLGLGISAQIVFYVLLFSGHFDPVLIILVHLSCLCGLFIYSRRYLSKQPPSFLIKPQSALIIFIILALMTLMAVILAQARPWGDWDGWSFWNYRANFFFRSGYDWPRMFQFNMEGYHPWMLPLTILWGWSFYAREVTIVHVAIGVIFTVSTVGLLIGALKQYVSFLWAALGGIFLASVPIYILHGTSQYADILAAYFILLSLVLTLDLLKFPSGNSAALTGLCLGLTASAKDNSILAALLLLVMIMVRLRRSGVPNLIKPLIWGFISVGLSVVIMKSFDVYNPDNNAYGAFWPGLWDLQRWAMIGRSIVHALTSFMWGGLWFLALAVLTLQRAKWIAEEIVFLVQFIFLYIIFYFLMFDLSVIKLQWLLGVSFDRLLYLLAPAVTFVMFYVLGEKEQA